MSAPITAAKSEQVAHAIERDIRAGLIGHGVRLQSEGALMARFAVGRNTVRRGLQMLSRRGLIATRTGIGSFVTYDGTTIDSSLGWTVALSHGTSRVVTRLLGVARGPCPRADRFLTGVRQGAGDYLCIDRLRHCLDAGLGISLERARLPWRADFQDVLTNGLQEGSLSRTLQELALVSVSGEESVSVIAQLGQDDATIMGRHAGDPMLRLERVTRLAGGGVLDYVESTLDPARFGLRLAF